MRYLGIDYGAKRVGLAITDSKGKVILPLRTIENNRNVYNKLKEIVLEREIEVVVVGFPRDLKGKLTSISEEVEKFVKRLKKSINIPVHLQDERYTSFEAEEKLKCIGVPLKKAKKMIDQLAAVEILRDFLEGKAKKA